VDEWGRSTLPGLWACGETSATGVHGANRLASNSLLEALVYGTRVATDIAHAPKPPPAGTIAAHSPSFAVGSGEAQATLDLRNVMYANVGLERNEAGLREALARIAALDEVFPHPGGELRNLLVVARLVTEAALARNESRGSHYRTDYPKTDEALARRSFTRLRSVA
jgi:L-aspartate oxidase